MRKYSPIIPGSVHLVLHIFMWSTLIYKSDDFLFVILATMSCILHLIYYRTFILYSRYMDRKLSSNGKLNTIALLLDPRLGYFSISVVSYVLMFGYLSRYEDISDVKKYAASFSAIIIFAIAMLGLLFRRR